MKRGIIAFSILAGALVSATANAAPASSGLLEGMSANLDNISKKTTQQADKSVLFQVDLGPGDSFWAISNPAGNTKPPAPTNTVSLVCKDGASCLEVATAVCTAAIGGVYDQPMVRPGIITTQTIGNGRTTVNRVVCRLATGTIN